MIVYSNKRRVPFQIDDDDYEAVSYYSWNISSCGYPVTTIGKAGNGRKTITLHRFLLGPAPVGHVWDHRDVDKMNNQRHNLRLVTFTRSSYNKRAYGHNRTGVLGVVHSAGRWIAQIKFKRKNIYLGTFRQFEMACAKRWAAELQLYGEHPGVAR